jgi:organic hydroperoxide reductase OsmC/OhrA
MRMKCSYTGSGNDIASLNVEHTINGDWDNFDLQVTSPGFEIFVYAIFTCQHMYMRVNCAERGLQLASSEGSITVGADENWSMDTLKVEFTANVASGSADQEDIDYIVSRMKQCPVSGNIREVSGAETSIALV